MISLDGVLQAPGAPEEDPSGKFEFGGWTAPYFDDAYNKAVREELQPAEYLLGRKTFEIWEAYWPRHADFWRGINEGMKYVMSKSRKKSDWKNTQFIKSVGDIRKLKSGKSNSKNSDIQVWGSSEIIHLLLKNDLVDELRLKIHPVILGKGKKAFDDRSLASAFKLMSSSVTTKGVILAVYKRAGKVKTGRVGAK